MNGHFAVRLGISLLPAPEGQSGDNPLKAGIPIGISSFVARQCDSARSKLILSFRIFLSELRRISIICIVSRGV